MAIVCRMFFFFPSSLNAYPHLIDAKCIRFGRYSAPLSYLLYDSSLLNVPEGSEFLRWSASFSFPC